LINADEQFFPDEDKGGILNAGLWICPYHNGRMCMEIIERVSGN